MENLPNIRDMMGILPEIWLGILFLIMIVPALLIKKQVEASAFFILLAGMAVSIVLDLMGMMDASGGLLFGGMISISGISGFARLLPDAGFLAALLVFRSDEGIRKENHRIEWFAMFPLMLMGLHFMAMANNLLFAWISLELVSICSYVLTTRSSKTGFSAEAGLKYLIFGGLSGAVMIYGISWIYGATGSLEMNAELAAALGQQDAGVLMIITLLIFVGISFKITAFPFHFWVADVYAAIPSGLAAWFSFAPKAAGFLLLMKLMDVIHLLPEQQREALLVMTGVLAAASMFAGNLPALRHQDFHRMMAYSGVAHSGYFMVLLIAGTPAAKAILIFYLAVYLLMNFLAFFLVKKIRYKAEGLQMAVFREAKLPGWWIFAMVTTMASLTGLPPTAGFLLKLRLIFASLNASSIHQNLVAILLIILLINTVISLFYYFRIPAFIAFSKKPEKKQFQLPASASVIAIILAIPLILLGILFSTSILDYIISSIG